MLQLMQELYEHWNSIKADIGTRMDSIYALRNAADLTDAAKSRILNSATASMSHTRCAECLRLKKAIAEEISVVL